MFEDFEFKYTELGYSRIVGIDEVGRGTLFGDVVACAIIMPFNEKIEGVRDSKKLSEKKREKLYEIILEKAIAIGIGRVDASTIDKVNIKVATHLAMSKAINNLRDKNGLDVSPDLLLIDAEKIESDLPQVSIIKGDDKCYSIACASIIAKVYRDRLCKKWSIEYPQYGLEKHKGYATRSHREAIKNHGYSNMHRKSFLKNIGKW